jgi:hypothetical protein
VTIDADSHGGNPLFFKMYRLGRIEVSRIRESGTWAACNPRDQVRRYNRLWRRIRFGQFLAGLRRHFVAGNQRWPNRHLRFRHGDRPILR